jgi:hypothetical protein
MIHLHSLALPARASVHVICLAHHASVEGVIHSIELTLAWK